MINPEQAIMMMLRQVFAGIWEPRRSGSRRRLFSPRLRLLGWMPASQNAQALFAEMFSQALASQMNFPEALRAASQVMQGSRLEELLRRVAGMVESGEDVVDRFRWAGIPLHPDVQAAIEVGESRGGLAIELAAAARRLDVCVSDHLNAAIGRPRSAREFAASLARLLAHEPMTVYLVHDAARLVGVRDRHFRHVIRWLAIDIEGGCPLADALIRYPRVFDSMFVECVSHAHSRESLRRVLARLGGEPTCQTAGAF
jgi:type II secretory pathway component PulF